MCEECVYFNEMFDDRLGTGFCELHKWEITGNECACDELEYDE